MEGGMQEAGDFRLKPRLHRTRNRKFESISLQQRVSCEPDFLDQGAKIAKRDGPLPSTFPRHGHTRGMDHVRLDPTRLQPARQPEAVAAGFEGNRNPRDRAARPD